jgi:hypothetical protein
MSNEYNIKFERGAVTITPGMGAKASTQRKRKTSAGATTFSKMLGAKPEPGEGGDGFDDDPGSGGGDPRSGRVVVIGPLVFCGSDGFSEAGEGGDGFDDDPGSGGTGPGSAPVVVIGPLVFCGRGRRSTASGKPKKDPVKPKTEETYSALGAESTETSSIKTFQMERQKERNWCWAAVTVSVDRYFDATSLDLEQCELAGKMFRAGVCGNEKKFNKPRKLQEALRLVDNLKDQPLNGPLRFERIRQEINANRPVCARIQWKGGGAHFIVIDGCTEFDSGFRQVHVQDPDSGPGVVSYDELAYAYRLQGEWSHSFLLKA